MTKTDGKLENAVSRKTGAEVTRKVAVLAEGDGRRRDPRAEMARKEARKVAGGDGR